MKSDINQRFMNQFTAFINSASPELATELVSKDAEFHVPGQSEPMRGPEGYLAIINMMRSGFSDIQWSLEETINENDKVAARFTMRGTHDGVFFGVPATGMKIKVQAINFYSLSAGKIVREFGQPDMLGILQQIGAVP